MESVQPRTTSPTTVQSYTSAGLSCRTAVTSSIGPAVLRSVPNSNLALLAGQYLRPDDRLCTLDKLLCHNPSIAIHRLPFEILHRIFYLCANSPPGSRHSHGPHGHWIGITHVCRQWREIALRSATLWRDVCLAWHPMWIKTTLERAKEVPLEVTSASGKYQAAVLTEDQFQLVLQHLGHTRSLTLNPHRQWLCQDGAAEMFCQSLVAPVSSLETLVLRFDVLQASRLSVHHSLFAGSAPRLRHMELRNVGIPLSLSKFTSLVRLSIISDRTPQHPTSNTILEALRVMTKLEELKITRHIPNSSNVLLSAPIELPLLSCLTLIGDVGDCLHFIKSLRLPHSVKFFMDLRCPGDARMGPYMTDFLGMLSAQSYVDNHRFRSVYIRSGPDHGLDIFEIMAWRDDTMTEAERTLAVKFSPRERLHHDIYGDVTDAFSHSISEILTTAETLKVGMTLWSAGVWLQTLRSAAVLRSLSTEGDSRNLCEALSMSTALQGNAEWQVTRSGRGNSSRVFCCPALTMLSLSCCAIKASTGGPLKSQLPVVPLAACLHRRELSGVPVKTVVLRECRISSAARRELENFVSRVIVYDEI